MMNDQALKKDGWKIRDFPALSSTLRIKMASLTESLKQGKESSIVSMEKGPGGSGGLKFDGKVMTLW